MTPAFVLALSVLLHPGVGPTRSEIDLARAVADIVTVDAPMPWRSREETAAVLVVSAWEESRFRMDAVGKLGERCALQVLPRDRAEARRLSSTAACVRRALEILRASARLCPDAPLAPYCGSCRSGLARRRSAKRLALAASLLARR